MVPSYGLTCSDCSNPFATPLIDTKYYLTASTSEGCTVSDSVLILVNEKPANAFTVNALSPVCGKNGSLSISINNTNSAPYEFSINHQSFSSNTEFHNLDAGNYTIEIRNNYGCTHDTLLIIKEDSYQEVLDIPNCFSPNDDLVNEFWYLTGQCIMNIDCKIFNRWGQQVASIDNPTNSWDGKYQNNDVPDGVYFYVIDVTYYSGNKSKKSGYINLFR